MIPEPVGIIRDVLERAGHSEENAVKLAWRIYHALIDEGYPMQQGQTDG